MNSLSSFKQLGKLLKSHDKEILLMTFASFLLYSVMISNELTNTYDGMWRGDYGYIGPWELSIGRWFWQYLNYLRLDLAPEPAISIISLLSLNVANFLFVEKLNLKNRWIRGITWLLLIGNSAVSIFLSYRYMVPTFTISYLLSVLGAYFFADSLAIDIKTRKTQVLIDVSFGVLCITFSLGLYQANLGCTLVFICVFLLSLPDSFFLSKNSFWLKTFVVTIALGISCVLYKILWDVHLYFQYVEASTYNGASEVSVRSMIASLPHSAKIAYVSAIHYFTKGQFNNIYQRYGLPFLILVFVIILFFIKLIYSKASLTKFVLSSAIIIIMPLCANVSLLLAPEAVGLQLQMTMPLAMIIPGYIALTMNGESQVDKKIPVRGFIFLGGVAILLFGNVMQVSCDQHEMLQTRRTSMLLMNRAVSYAESQGALSDPDIKVVFAGIPARSPQYKKDKLYGISNSYSHYGEFWTGGNCVTQSYSGYLRDCGINLNLLTDDAEYHRVLDLSEVQQMPSYPASGCVANVDGYLVIKLSP